MRIAARSALSDAERVALTVRWAQTFDFHRATPIACGGNRAAVGAETNAVGLRAKPGCAHLAQIMLSTPGHIGGAGVPDM